MIYSEPLLWQVYNFLFFFGFGFLCGFLFRFIEFIRSLFSGKKAAVIAQDVAFSVLTTVLMFLFLLTYADGRVRLNLILAAALGALVFFLTLGNVVKKFFSLFAAAIKKTVAVLSKPFVLLASVLKRAGALLDGKTKKKAEEFKKKRKSKKKNKQTDEKKPPIQKSKRKKHLKNQKKSV